MPSNRYVIDANVAKGAGKPTTPRVLNCVRLLTRVVDGAHFCVFNEALLLEWSHHASVFARGWLRQMHARKRYQVIEVAKNVALRKALLRAAIPEPERLGVEKDLHLLELALTHDKFIVTLEVRLPNYLKGDKGLAKFHSQITWIGEDPEIIPVAKSKP